MDVDSVDAAESSAERLLDAVNPLLPRELSGDPRGESSRKMRDDGPFRPPRPSTKVDVVASMLRLCFLFLIGLHAKRKPTFCDSLRAPPGRRPAVLS